MSIVIGVIVARASLMEQLSLSPVALSGIAL